MLLSAEAIAGIVEGSIRVVFRRWYRPTVRSGGTLLTAGGLLEIAKVERVEEATLSEADAQLAGYASLAELRAALATYEGPLYRIELGAMRADPRIALRQALPTDSEAQALLKKLAGLDARAVAPWTRATLELIAARPAVAASILCRSLGRERAAFKVDVRKLKALGLTESLEIGYRVSPRGLSVLERLRAID